MNEPFMNFVTAYMISFVKANQGKATNKKVKFCTYV